MKFENIVQSLLNVSLYDVCVCSELMWGCWSPINGCHSNATLQKHHWIMSILVNVRFFLCSCKNDLCVHIYCLTYGLFNFWGILCIYLIRNTRQLTCSKCKVASFLWFAQFSMRIYGSVQLLSCSNLVDHTSIMLIFWMNLIGQRSFSKDLTWHFLIHPFL